MPKVVNKLTAKSVEKKVKSGYYLDGNGLYLQISKSGSKSWVLRFMLNGRAREMGLGSAKLVTLEAARLKAVTQHEILSTGEDPIEARQSLEIEKKLEKSRQTTFDQCAERYIKAHRAGWKNAKHAAQWENTLKTYASPVFGDLSVQAVDEVLVLEVLEPIWHTKTETATRIRNRIELVLDWARARKYRTGENPARWRGHLDKLLPKRSKIAPPRNHPALPYVDAPAFMERLRVRAGVAAKAMEFVILTAARVSEAVNATWDEVDIQNRVWTVPGERMKAKRAHRVPLSHTALKVLAEMKQLSQGTCVFPGWRIKRPITGAAVLKVLREMGYSELTVHGFRSTFRDWCAEQTNYPYEVAEMALAHTIKDKAEAAYRRGDLLEKRARLMDDWAKYLAHTKAASVTPIRKKKA